MFLKISTILHTKSSQKNLFFRISNKKLCFFAQNYINLHTNTTHHLATKLFMKLLISALTKYLAGMLLFGALIFLPAGTLHWSYGWLMMGILFVPMLLMGAVMLIYAPDLLNKRLKNKEERSEQKGVVALSGLTFMASFVIAGLNHRYMWTTLPSSFPIIASILFLIGYTIYAEVMRENQWLSRTIETHDEQTIISTGLYAIVRHPMYTATIIMFLAIPLVLGSWPSFLLMLPYIPIILRRINDEERLLNAELKGYTDYCTQVRWRLVPFVY